MSGRLLFAVKCSYIWWKQRKFEKIMCANILIKVYCMHIAIAIKEAWQIMILFSCLFFFFFIKYELFEIAISFGTGNVSGQQIKRKWTIFTFSRRSTKNHKNCKKSTCIHWCRKELPKWRKYVTQSTSK